MIPRVLQVTGAYYPEISAAGLQIRAVARALGPRARFSVLTTSVDPALAAVESVADVTVYRVPIDVQSAASTTLATLRVAVRFLVARGSFDIVHFHGFSRKNVPLTLLARLFRKPIVVTMHTAAQDDPQAVAARGAISSWAFARAERVVSVSPYMSERYRQAGLPAGKLRLIPNGIDTDRFRPATSDERASLRGTLGLGDGPIVLFVGFFSRDKRPDLLFQAWSRMLDEGGPSASLVFVGDTSATYQEVDASLADAIRARAAAADRSRLVRFVKPTHAVDDYLRAADVFVMPSVRETQSVALLEAMASGLPVIATRLPGATDVFVTDRINGRLFPADDARALADALRDVLADREGARALGARGRETVVERYPIQAAAEQWLAVYHDVSAGQRQ